MLNDNIIDDHLFDQWSKELVELQRNYPEISEKTPLFEYFKDWDGSTGAFLPFNLDWVAPLWKGLKKYVKEENNRSHDKITRNLGSD